MYVPGGKRERREGEDLRRLPTYTLPEAARFLGASPRTLQSWFADVGGFLRPSERREGVTLLSFRDVAEAYVLTVLTRFYQFRLSEIRKMMAIAKEETGFERPLIEANLKVLFHSLILEKPVASRQPRQAIDLPKNRNLVFTHFVDQLGTRIVRDEDNGPLRIYPWRLADTGDESQPVSLDPEIISGRLCVTGTRVPVQILLGKKRAGKSEEEISRAYRIPAKQVRQALQHIERPLRKKAA